MAVFTLVSVTGAPGVTTCALGLALAWPRDVVLVDADRFVSQTLPVGYFSGVTTGGRGLTSLSQAYRDGLDLAETLPGHFVKFPATGEADSPGRWVVPGFARPGSAQLFEPVWPELAAALEELDRRDIDVIVDVGRWGPPPALVASTRALVLVTRAHLQALAGLRLYLPDARGLVAGVASCSLGLLVISGDDSYDSDEIAAHFELPVWGVLPWQPAEAAVLSDNTASRRRKSTRPLARAFTVSATSLSHVSQRWDSRVRRAPATELETPNV